LARPSCNSHLQLSNLNCATSQPCPGTGVSPLRLMHRHPRHWRSSLSPLAIRVYASSGLGLRSLVMSVMHDPVERNWRDVIRRRLPDKPDLHIILCRALTVVCLISYPDVQNASRLSITLANGGELQLAGRPGTRSCLCDALVSSPPYTSLPARSNFSPIILQYAAQQLSDSSPPCPRNDLNRCPSVHSAPTSG